MQNHDPFLEVKVDTLMASQDAVLTLCRVLGEMKLKNLSEKEKKEMFIFFLKVNFHRDFVENNAHWE